jgi:triosephosphate isomerase
MRQPLVAGNWKLNGSKQSTKHLIEGIIGGMDSVQKAEVVVCPPFIYLQQAAEQLAGTPVVLGAQNCSEKDSGAYTGETAASMIKEFGAKYIIIGHSERRAIYGETNSQIAIKFDSVLSAGLKPILCVGELLDQREAGETENIVGQQLDAVINQAGVKAFQNAVIAYEPVWAIGTGKTATPDQAQDVHNFIRTRFSALDSAIAEQLQILYGGSVKPDNAKELFAMQDIDGGLIGGAALDSEGFLGICQAPND